MEVESAAVLCIIFADIGECLQSIDETFLFDESSAWMRFLPVRGGAASRAGILTPRHHVLTFSGGAPSSTRRSWSSSLAAKKRSMRLSIHRLRYQ